MNKLFSKATMKQARVAITMLLLLTTSTIFAEDGNWSIDIAIEV